MRPWGPAGGPAAFQFFQLGGLLHCSRNREESNSFFTTPEQHGSRPDGEDIRGLFA